MKMLKVIKKKLLPKKLLPRMFLIIVVPTVIAQIISTYIFYSKHWDSISKYIIYTLSNEISLIVNTYSNLPKAKVPKISKYTYLRYTFKPRERIVQMESAQSFPEEIQILKTNIEYNLSDKIINIDYNKRNKEIKVDVGDVSSGVLSFYINHKKIFIESTYMFMIWMLGSTLILLMITIIFAKNQIKSIAKLSTIADRLSKGYKVKKFIPRGAQEVRNVGYAFLRMKNTIENEVKQKAEMLAWVSHDLRTPLTRMRLQLELAKDKVLAPALTEDIDQMRKIINDYLEFAKGEDGFATTTINLSEFLKGIIKVSKIGTKIIFDEDIAEDVHADINENQFKRALFNLIDNAKKFGSKVYIKLMMSGKKNVLIEIHDNGPGISKSEMKSVFKPFYRGDSCRNQKTGSVGLGIPIANDIIKKHEGSMTLSKSSKGGLLVTVGFKVNAKVKESYIEETIR